MKIKCSQESLFYGLQTVQKAISNKLQMPIYNGILFEAGEDKLHLFATDLSIGIDCYIPAKVEEEGSVVVPNKIIISLVQKLSQGDMAIESTEGVSIIKTDKSQYEILGFLAEEFSSFPKIKPLVSLKIPQGKLKRAIEKVIFSVSREETRAFLNGASFKVSGNKLEITSTDSHRLSHNKCDIVRIGQSDKDEHEVIVPQRTLSELLKLLDESDEVFVNINMEDRQMMFVLYPEEQEKSIRVYSRLIEGDFPDFKQIIPKEFKTRIKIDNKNLEETIGRVSLFTDDNIGCINMSTKDIDSEIKLKNESEMILDSKTQSLGKAKEKMVCFKKGDDIKITINSKYILDILNAIKTDNVVIKIVDKLSPIVIVSETGKDCFYIVMPVRSGEND